MSTTKCVLNNTLVTNSPGRIRTCDPTINSRLHYRCATEDWEYPPLVSRGGSIRFPLISHAGWNSDSFFSRRREPGCIPVP